MITSAAVALPLKKRVLKRRRLVAVDIENVIGGAVRTPADVLMARQQIEEMVGSIGGDQVIVGASHYSALNAANAWAGARLVLQSGANGADLRLIHELQFVDIPLRFDEVVLVSGDGIFVDVVCDLQACGVYVTVVAPREHCSKRLQLCASEVRLFERAMAEMEGVA